jgi:hypothetical protein
LDRAGREHPGEPKSAPALLDLRSEGARNERLSDEGKNAGFWRPELSREEKHERLTVEKNTGFWRDGERG